MTRIKKFAALVLAMMMALSLMVTPALAAGIARVPAMKCPVCLTAMDVEYQKKGTVYQYQLVCPNGHYATGWEDIDW